MLHAGHDMFMQDIWGLEKYIEVVKLHWVDLHWIVGLGLMVIAYMFADMEIKRAKREYESRTAMLRRMKEINDG